MDRSSIKKRGKEREMVERREARGREGGGEILVHE